MNTSETLSSLGLCELPKNSSINGFNRSIIFICNDEVAKIMKQKHKTIIKPQFMIVRNGKVTNNWKSYVPETAEIKIRFWLFMFDSSWKIQCIQDRTGKKIKSILWKYDDYYIGAWKSYTAPKYMYEREKRFLWKRINLENL